MLNKSEFAKIRKEMSDLDDQREKIIQKSRDLIMTSKKIIYAVHRDDLKSAEKAMGEIEKQKKELDHIDTNLDTNINKVAFQEYAEAACFYHFVKTGKIPTKTELKLSGEDYLLGLCDLTGELMRKAVNAVIRKNYKEAEKIKDIVDDIYGEFLQFNLRNGELRKKSDQIKWNLKKLEDVVFELKLKDKLE